MVAVVGPSGSGKSSVVQAGLLPLLRRERPPAQTWDGVSFTPGNDPFHRLASALIPLLESNLSEIDRLTEAQKLGKVLAAGEAKLEAVISRVIEKSNGTGRLLLVADQFEELFTLTPEPGRRPLAQTLLRALGSAPFTLLVTLRADFYSQIIALDRELSDRLASAQVNIGALTQDELWESITEPAKLVGLKFEPGLVERILADVGSEPGHLPLVEFALTELWQHLEGNVLANRAYDQIGAATGALAQRAEAEFKQLTAEEQAAARRLFSRLVRVARPEEAREDTRQRADLNEADALGKGVPNRLANARLLVTDGETSDGTLSVEVAHEALIRNWGRLRVWLNEDREFLLWRQRLRVQVDAWQGHGRDAGYLFRGQALSEAERWLLGRPHDLTDPEQQFIREGFVLREREREEEKERQLAEIESVKRLAEAAGRIADAERRRARVLGRSLLALGALFLIAAGAALFARRQQLTAQSRALAAQAEQLLARDQPVALELALRSWHTAKTPEADLVVTHAFAQLPAKLEGHTDSVFQAAFSPDGQRIVTASFDKTARVWNAANGQLLAKLEGHTSTVFQAVFSSDGQRIVTASLDKTARVWNAANGQLLAKLEGHTDQVWRAAFSPDGQRIVTASFDETARVWNAANGKLLAKLEGHTGKLWDAAFSPDGQRIVTAGGGAARIYRVLTLSDIAELLAN